MSYGYNVNDVVSPTMFVRSNSTKEEVLRDFNERSVVSDSKYHERIVEAFGGEKALGSYPVHDLADNMGYTGYIDFLSPDDLNSPVVRGVDCFKRPFVSVRVRNRAEDTKYVFTIFKRYSSADSTLWSVGMRRTLYFADDNNIWSGDTLYDSDYKVLKFIQRLLSNSDPEYELA